MQVYKETIWHFTCQSCNGFWSIAASDQWVPSELFCTHCGSKRTHDNELIEWVDDNDYQPVKKDLVTNSPNANEKDEWCSCGHRILDCDCKAGCKCGCNKRFLRAY
jgi:hypothetical protein